MKKLIFMLSILSILLVSNNSSSFFSSIKGTGKANIENRLKKLKYVKKANKYITEETKVEVIAKDDKKIYLPDLPKKGKIYGIELTEHLKKRKFFSPKEEFHSLRVMFGVNKRHGNFKPHKHHMDSVTITREDFKNQEIKKATQKLRNEIKKKAKTSTNS